MEDHHAMVFLSLLFFALFCCPAIETYPKIQISEYGTAFGDDQIMAEIYARGPVAAYIDAVCLSSPFAFALLTSSLPS